MIDFLVLAVCLAVVMWIAVKYGKDFTKKK